MDLAYITDHARAITVVHLEALLPEPAGPERHTPADYHLHILFFGSVDEPSLGAICLDTDDVSIESVGDRQMGELIRALSFDLARRFVDRINSCLAVGKLSEDRVFKRSDQALWDKYNRLKRRSFISSLENIQAYIPVDELHIQDVDTPASHSTAHVDHEDYSWARFHLSEERTVSVTE